MKNQKKNQNGGDSKFDYEEFEKKAISQLRAGGDLIGTDGIFKELISRIVTAALEGEIDGHIVDEKSNGVKGNRRNGRTSKKLKTSLGEVPISPPRDRLGSFEPQLVGKWDRNLNSGLDSQILELYSLGNSVLDIQSHLMKMYGVGLSSGQISSVTEKVWEEVIRWQSRALSSFYVLIYLDAIHFRVRENGEVKSKAVYTVYGVDAYGSRDVLALHIGQEEGAKEWGRILEKIKSRGVEDVLFFAVDGLAGFSNAILEVFPNSIVQRCIVHMVRTSMRFVADKDYRPTCKDLKKIYTADDEAAGLVFLDEFDKKWGKQYPEIAQKWRDNWTELTAFFGFNWPIRKMIYTTNAVENLHRHLRKTTKSKGAFCNDKALMKLLYLTLMRKRESWNRSVFQWSAVQRGLIREFGDRYTKNVVL